LLILLFAEFDLINFVKRRSHLAEENFYVKKMISADLTLTQFTKPYKNKFFVFIFLGILAGGFIFRYKMIQQEKHNIEVGLPIDFDPETYLILNPGLQEFWRSQGIFESGQPLIDRTEIHYKYFGEKDHWRYRGPFQMIFYPK
jgi:hypothetical protein